MPFFGNRNRPSPTTDVAKHKEHTKKIKWDEPGVLRLAWLGLKVADVVAEAGFLEHVLELKLVHEGNSTSGHHIRYDCGPLELELVTGGTTWATRPKPRQGQPDVTLIPSFKVDNISQIAGYLTEREVPTTQIFEQGWVASFFFLDVERNLWQVSETRTEAPSATEKAALINALWLSVEDFPAQVAFYRDVLGLPLVAQPTQPRPITREAELYHQENPISSPDQVEFSEDGKVAETSSLEAIFFAEGAQLALSPGGKRLENGRERIWGRDTAFMPGLQTTHLADMVARLHAAGIETSGPYSHIGSKTVNGRKPTRANPALPHVTQAFRFTDPEGNPWQIFE
jgi:catechol 2,3-dioxygenase-like lactoylglutathione lyase family enzyme